MIGASAVQAPPQDMLDMVLGASAPTQIVLLVLALFSVTALWVILAKARQLRGVRLDGDEFLMRMENAANLGEASQAVLSLPESPYTRLFRGGLNFFAELNPGALSSPAPGSGLSLTQLEALRLAMDKVEAEEVDELGQGLGWLAIIGSVSPLLGLMGTVIGIMNTFLGITASRSTNISAVAPGVAEALITTVAGLAVAIPSVIAYNHFVGRVNLVRGEFEGFGSEFIGALAKERHL